MSNEAYIAEQNIDELEMYQRTYIGSERDTISNVLRIPGGFIYGMYYEFEGDNGMEMRINHVFVPRPNSN